MKIDTKETRLGVIVRDINLLDKTSYLKNDILGLLDTYKVVTFEDQNFSIKDLYDVCSGIGSTYKLPHYRKNIMPDSSYPDIQLAERNYKNTYWLFGGYWHSDGSYSNDRPDYTCLYNVKCPKEGGDTEFIDQNEILSAIEPSLIKVLYEQTISSGYTRNTLRDAILSRGELGFNACTFFDRDFSEMEIELMYSDIAWKKMEDSFLKNEVQSIQPCIVEHPYTKEHFLNINPSYSMYINNIERDESDKILNTIFKYQKEVNPYKLKWKPNMFTIWDNRMVLHRATHSDPNVERTMYRLMLKDNRSI